MEFGPPYPQHFTVSSHTTQHTLIHLCKGRRSLGGEDLLRGGSAVREWEFEVAGYQLLDVWSLDVAGVLEFDNFENVNAPESSPMSSCHILVQSLHGIGSAHLSVLLVHIVRATS